MEKIVDQIIPTIGRGSRTEYDIPMEERDKAAADISMEERDKSADSIPQKPRPILESQRMNCTSMSLSIRYKIQIT